MFAPCFRYLTCAFFGLTCFAEDIKGFHICPTCPVARALAGPAANMNNMFLVAISAWVVGLGTLACSLSRSVLGQVFRPATPLRSLHPSSWRSNRRLQQTQQQQQAHLGVRNPRDKRLVRRPCLPLAGRSSHHRSSEAHQWFRHQINRCPLGTSHKHTQMHLRNRWRP